MGPAGSGTVVEPGPVPPLEKLHTAEYDVVRSAGLILPDGRERTGLCAADGHVAGSRERRMIYVLLCERRNKSSDPKQMGGG